MRTGLIRRPQACLKISSRQVGPILKVPDLLHEHETVEDRDAEEPAMNPIPAEIEKGTIQ